MHKKVKFNKSVKESILKGCKTVSDAVGSTQGPAGRYVIIEGHGYPHPTKDGVSVASDLWNLEDPFMTMSSRLMINSARKQVEDSGDGTTSVIVIANELVKLGMAKINKDTKLVMVKRGMDRAVSKITRQLKNQSRTLKTLDQLRQVATIALNGDTELGDLVGNAIQKVGKWGSVTQERNRTNKHEVEYQEGYEWPCGVDHQAMLTDQQSQRAEVAKPYILVTDHVISMANELIPIIEKVIAEVQTTGKVRELIIISNEVKNEALASLIRNRVDGTFLSMSIKADGLAERKTQNLEDIASITGATMISYSKGKLLRDAQLTDLGTCDKLVSNATKTIIINGAGSATKTIAQLETIINTSENDAVISDAKERMARLNGGVAIIKVGGKTESEQRELMDRVDDAIRATRSAQEEGIAIGGGCAYLVASENVTRDTSQDKDINLGENLIHEAIEAPFINMLTNANVRNKPPWYTLGYKMTEQIRLGMIHGYDTLNRKVVLNNGFVNMWGRGIIDPVKVLRTALENANSIAQVLLTCDTIIVTEES